MRICRRLRSKSYGIGAIELPDVGIPSWTLAPVEIEVSLDLCREDLCVSRDFYDDFAVGSLDELVSKFLAVNPSDTPLSFRFAFQFAAISYQVYVSANLARRGDFDVVPRGSVQGAAPWEEAPDDTILELFIDRNYKRRLRVGGVSEAQATLHWERMAKFFRSRINALRRCSHD